MLMDSDSIKAPSAWQTMLRRVVCSKQRAGSVIRKERKWMKWVTAVQTKVIWIIIWAMYISQHLQHYKIFWGARWDIQLNRKAQEKQIYYRTSGVTTSTVESDVTAPSVCVVLLLVYWPDRLHHHGNACASPSEPYLPSLSQHCVSNRQLAAN